jgi:transposase-like protein
MHNAIFVKKATFIVADWFYGCGNNRVEADHGKLKRLIHPASGFKSMKTAYATIKGFEVMRMFRKGQMKSWQ